MTCHHGSSDGPRLVGPRHDGTHDGCDLCSERHCFGCSWRHLDVSERQTCPSCIGNVRHDLATISELMDALPDQAHHGGYDGHLEAGRPIPGGEAMVLMWASGYTGALHACSNPDEAPDDPIPPLLLLATWEDDWRSCFGHGAAQHRATIGNATEYLDKHLHHGAQWHDAFDEFASDIQRCVARLEAVLHRGTPTWRGVPCVQCGAALLRDYDTRHGFLDSYRCPGCGQTATRDQYHYAVGVAYRANAPALSAVDMAEQYGVKRGSLTGWASLGRVRKRGHDLAGRVLYDVADTLEQAGSDTPRTASA